MAINGTKKNRWSHYTFSILVALSFIILFIFIDDIISVFSSFTFIQGFIITFLAIIIEALPFLLIGCYSIYTDEKPSNKFSRNPTTIDNVVFQIVNETIQNQTIIGRGKSQRINLQVEVRNNNHMDKVYSFGVALVEHKDGKKYGTLLSSESDSKAFSDESILPDEKKIVRIFTRLPIDIEFEEESLFISKIRIRKE